jgi:hypothetical protein
MSWEQYRKYYSAEYVRNYVNSVSLEERNNFSDDVNIMIIGHLTHLDILIDFYKGIKNVLFVVDDSEEQYKIDALIENGFEVIILNVPSFSGFGNVNKQCASSMLGANYLNDRQRKYCIRMRSDQFIVQLHAFINKFKFDKLGFFSYVNSPDTGTVDGGYLMDYCITGPVVDMLDLFDYQESTIINRPAETKIVETFLTKRNMENNHTFTNLKTLFYFFLPILEENNINFLMVKQDYHDWTVAMPLQPWLYWYK